MRLLNNLILYSTTQTDDSHAVPINDISLKLTKNYDNNVKYVGKIKRGLSN